MPYTVRVLPAHFRKYKIEIALLSLVAAAVVIAFAMLLTR